MPPSDLFDDSEVQGLGKLVFLVVWECGKACKGYFLWFAGLARGRNGAFLGFVGLARGRNGAFLGFAGLARGRNGAFLGFARAASEEKGGFFAVARAVNLLRGSFLIVSRAANYQQGSFLIVSRTANYQQGSVLIVSRAANSQQGSFFTLCTVCKLLARGIFSREAKVTTRKAGESQTFCSFYLFKKGWKSWGFSLECGCFICVAYEDVNVATGDVCDV